MMASFRNETHSNEATTKSWYQSAANAVQSGGNEYNESIELNSPSFRSDLEDHYVLILFFFALLIVLGTVLNFVEIYIIVRNKLYTEATNTYFLNLAVADIIKCNVTLPLSVLSLLFQNWILGEFLCYFLPMLQDVPVHATVLTLLMIIFDRYLFVRNPAKARLPGFIFSTGTWLTAVCIALPYPIYTTYLNLQELVNVSHASGAGICLFGIEKNLKEYSHGIFIGMFVIPLTIIGGLYIHLLQTLEDRDQPIVIDGNEIVLRATFRRYYSLHRFSRGIFTSQVGSGRAPDLQQRTANSSIVENYDIDPKGEEKRVQQHFLYIVSAFVVCFGPLNLFSKVIFLNIHETYDITSNIDRMFVVLTVIGFLPTIITPLIVLSLLMNEEDKITLKNYFKLDRGDEGVESFELEENNFPNVAYITHPSAATISTNADAHIQISPGHGKAEVLF